MGPALRPRKVWVVKYRLRVATLFTVCLSPDDAKDAEANILLMDGKDVEIWECKT
jgi:hypothetical protein